MWAPSAGQPGGAGPADTVCATGDDHRSAGEAFKLSLPHGWSLPSLYSNRMTAATSSAPPLDLASSCANQHRADDHEHDAHDRAVVLDQPAPGTARRSNHSVSIHYERRDRHDHCETGDHGVAQGEARRRPAAAAPPMVSPAPIVRASSFGFATGNRKPSPAAPVGDATFHRRHPHGRQDMLVVLWVAAATSPCEPQQCDSERSSS